MHTKKKSIQSLFMVFLTMSDCTEIFIGTIVTMSFTYFKCFYLSKEDKYFETVISGIGWATNHTLRKYYLKQNQKNLFKKDNID
jgi:hypothetical protein